MVRGDQPGKEEIGGFARQVDGRTANRENEGTMKEEAMSDGVKKGVFFGMGMDRMRLWISGNTWRRRLNRCISRTPVTVAGACETRTKQELRN